MENQPYGRLSEIIYDKAFTTHPYKHPVIGSMADLEAASIEDVREFHRTYYRPDNATLVVAGDFEPAQLQAWVDKYFGPVPRPAAPIPRVKAEEPAWTRDREARVAGPQVPLPAVALVWQAPPVTAADAAALKVAAGLLAAGESSRLHQSLVYRQRLAAQAGFEADLRAGPGLLVAYAIAAGGKPVARVAQALADFGLSNRADHRPDQLSGGQRQRVAIARATIMQPAVILADEPTGNLDRATGDEVVRLLEALNSRGVTVIVVTHDAALGARARRQLMMEDGSLKHDSSRARCAAPT